MSTLTGQPSSPVSTPGRIVSPGRRPQGAQALYWTPDPVSRPSEHHHLDRVLSWVRSVLEGNSGG
ncbi:MAG: hypothetical protein ACI8PZ_001979 [Myxococcota bacterium]|jgi:hypothetical protein